MQRIAGGGIVRILGNMYKPNILRKPSLANLMRHVGAPAAAAALALSLTACTSNEPDPGPSSPPASAGVADTFPSCKVVATVDGKTVNAAVEADADKPGEYFPDAVTYYFGDDSESITRGYNEGVARHTYATAGSFTVRAFLELDVAPGVVPPVKNGHVSCKSATVAVQ